MTNKYKKPPLAEVLCEFRFDLENPNDPILPGLLYGKLENEFPIRKQNNAIPFIPFEGIGIEQFIPPSLAQFYSNDESKLVQVGQDLLSINCVKNYPHWEQFKPIILDVFHIYLEIAKPKKFRRIGMRAINKIVFDHHDIPLQEYFHFYPTSPFNDSEPISTFVFHIEKSFNNDRDRLIMKNITIKPPVNTQAAFLLDFDYILRLPEKISFEEVDEWLEDAHTWINQAFEASITNKLRDKFEIS